MKIQDNRVTSVNPKHFKDLPNGSCFQFAGNKFFYMKIHSNHYNAVNLSNGIATVVANVLVIPIDATVVLKEQMG